MRTFVPVHMLANRLVMALLALNVVGAIVAVMLDLPAQLGTNARAGDTVGVEIITVGSATSAPWPPLLALIVGALLATPGRRARVVGYVLLALASLHMIIGVIGEFASGIPFTGGRYAVFVGFSIALFLLAAALFATAIRAITRPGATDRHLVNAIPRNRIVRAVVRA